MGSAALTVSIAGLSTVMSQDVWYDNAITKPIEQVQSYLGTQDQIKAKYEQFISEDKEFLSKMDIPKEILETNIILKHHTNLDKTFYPFMKFGQLLFNWNEEEKLEGDEKYSGKFSTYNSFNRENGSIQEYIMLGVNSLEKKEGIYKAAYEIFGNDEQKLTSFIFFHELGHRISNKLFSEEKNVNEILKTFEKEKGVILSVEDKKIIQSQYSETFSDSFSISMMAKKYSDLDFEKTKEMIAGYRLNSNSTTHLSSPGLIELGNIDRDSSLQDIFIAAEKSALTTTQFYSNIDFSKVRSDERQAKGREKPVQLINLDYDSVRQKINNAREKFLNAQNTQSKNLKI